MELTKRTCDQKHVVIKLNLNWSERICVPVSSPAITATAYNLHICSTVPKGSFIQLH